MRHSIAHFVLLIFAISVGGNAQVIQPNTAQTNIDQLGICQCLTQEERDTLKRYPEICEALAVVNQRPRYTKYQPGPWRCGSLKDITNALAGIGDKEAARVSLRLTHKAFVDMPMMLQPDLFFNYLQSGFNYTGGVFSPDEFFPQEFLDDLIVRCHDDFSDDLYRDTHFDGNHRFREALRGVVDSMVSLSRMPSDDLNDNLLEKGLNFIARLPKNKTCEGMRKDLFLQLFRYCPLERASSLVDGLADPDTQKEFSVYLAELKESQQHIEIRKQLSGGWQPIEPLTRETVQQLIETTPEAFGRCEAMLFLATNDLEKGNIDQAVKQAREAQKLHTELVAESLRTKGSSTHGDFVKGIEYFYSSLAKAAIQAGKYDVGIDYLIEGAGLFPEYNSYHWSSYLHHDPFMHPPLLELFTAVQEDSVRTTVRKKLQTLLELFKDYETTAQSQQLRAVLETQIALGFEEDAIPVLKTTKPAEKEEVPYRPVQEPLWNGTTIVKFRLRCGLFDEAMKTYEETDFRDSPLMSNTSTTDRTWFLQELAGIATARNDYNHAEKIIELIRQESEKSLLQISLARAYQKSGDWDKALKIVATLEPLSSRPYGYLVLLHDLLVDESLREQSMEHIGMLRDMSREMIQSNEDFQKRIDQYFALIALLYWCDQRETAMRSLDEVDSPYIAAWILLNIATAHEMDTRGVSRTSDIPAFHELNSQQIYPDYYQMEQLVSGEYNSSNHYLNLASAIQSAEKILEHATENNSQRGMPFEPDRAAMRILLDRAFSLIEKESNSHFRANVLAAIGKMEFVYLSKEDAKKHCNEALNSLKAEKTGPVTIPASQLAPLFLELREKDKAFESIQISLFGYDPDKPTGDVDMNQAVIQQLRKDVNVLESLARGGDGELAYKLFLQTCENVDFNVQPQPLEMLQIIALYHDSQNPVNPLLPKAKEQYRLYYAKAIRGINGKKEGYEKESALHGLLYRWMNGEKRIQAVRAEIENRNETGDDPSGIAEKHIQRRQLGYGNFLNEFGNPFYLVPVIRFKVPDSPL